MLIGVVGKPNVGKSTFFKALTLAEVEIANYPFATIKPNHGVGHVRVSCVDKEFQTACNPREGYCIKGERFVPVDVMDVAGLVPGAHEGKGLGNQFLDDLRQAHVLIHVVDASGGTNEKGETTDEGSHDPVGDVEFLETELDLWYLSILKKPWERFARKVAMEKQQVARAIAEQFSGLNADEVMMKNIIMKLGLSPEDVAHWNSEQLMQFAIELRKRTKPMIIAANKCDRPASKDNIAKLNERFPDYHIIPCSAESELALKEAAKHGLIEYVPGDGEFRITADEKLSDKQKAALDLIRQDVMGVFDATGVQRTLDAAVFELLKYVAIFPGGVNKLADQHGNVLPDCFLLPPGSTALDFAYRLHTDFGDNFIKAIDVKSRLPVGKDHVLKSRDVVEIMAR